MLTVRKYPDPILATKCDPWTSPSFADLHATLNAMFEVMETEKGIGLAANQVGINARIFIMKDQKGKLWEFINPEIVERDGGQQINEGCLSAPGVFVQVPRSQSVTVKAQDRNGEEFRVVCQDIEAVCVQHELDHLDGVFFLSKTSRNQRRAALKTLGLK